MLHSKLSNCTRRVDCPAALASARCWCWGPGNGGSFFASTRIVCSMQPRIRPWIQSTMETIPHDGRRGGEPQWPCPADRFSAINLLDTAGQHRPCICGCVIMQTWKFSANAASLFHTDRHTYKLTMRGWCVCAECCRNARQAAAQPSRHRPSASFLLPLPSWCRSAQPYRKPLHLNHYPLR